jgi:hypothetical protein
MSCGPGSQPLNQMRPCLMSSRLLMETNQRGLSVVDDNGSLVGPRSSTAPVKAASSSTSLDVDQGRCSTAAKNCAWHLTQPTQAPLARNGRHSRPRLPRHLRQGGRTIMTRIADDFDAIRRRLAELANKPEKLTTITPVNSPLHPLGSPMQSPPTQCPPTPSPPTQGRTCRSCGAIQNFIVDRRCWVCPRCGTTASPF